MSGLFFLILDLLCLSYIFSIVDNMAKLVDSHVTTLALPDEKQLASFLRYEPQETWVAQFLLAVSRLSILRSSPENFVTAKNFDVPEWGQTCSLHSSPPPLSQLPLPVSGSSVPPPKAQMMEKFPQSSLVYGAKIFLNTATLHLRRGHRYGLCGKNRTRSGMSTLMRAITDESVNFLT